MKTLVTLTVMAFGSLAYWQAPDLDRQAASRPSTIVRYDDLDLSKPHGIATLERRVQGAAARVCDVQYAGKEGVTSQKSACIREAAAAALTQIR